MQSIGLTFITLIGIVMLGFGGFYSIQKLKDPKAYIVATDQKVGDLYKINQSSIDEDISLYKTVPIIPEIPEPVADPIKTTSDTSSDTSLTAKIQKIIDQKIVLKNGSRGAYVGAIQEFMNLYFKKSAKIDNDFGKLLEADLKKFQTQNKISATGQTGPQTLNAMVAWLKKN